MTSIVTSAWNSMLVFFGWRSQYANETDLAYLLALEGRGLLRSPFRKTTSWVSKQLSKLIVLLSIVATLGMVPNQVMRHVHGDKWSHETGWFAQAVRNSDVREYLPVTTVFKREPNGYSPTQNTLCSNWVPKIQFVLSAAQVYGINDSVLSVSPNVCYPLVGIWEYFDNYVFESLSAKQLAKSYPSSDAEDNTSTFTEPKSNTSQRAEEADEPEHAGASPDTNTTTQDSSLAEQVTTALAGCFFATVGWTFYITFTQG